MLIKKTLSAIFISILLFGNVIAQQKTIAQIKQPEISAELKKNAVEFLRQTIKEIPNLKAEENRQFFTIETARLLWKYDEKEARTMFEQAMNEIRHKLAEAKEEFIKREKAKWGKYGDLSNTTNTSNLARVMYNQAISTVYEANRAVEVGNEKEYYAVREKYKNLLAIRKNLIKNLSEVDAWEAYKFLDETQKTLPRFFLNPGDYEESRMLANIVDTLIVEDIDKSIEIVRLSLKKCFGLKEIGMLNNIYKANREKGRVFAEEILQNATSLKHPGFYSSAFKRFLQFSIISKKQFPQNPLLSNDSIKVLVNLLGDSLLDSASGYAYDFEDSAKLIEKYAPVKSAKIRQKFRKKSKPADYEENIPMSAEEAAERAAEAANRAVNEVKATQKKSKKSAEKVETPKPKDEWEVRQETKTALYQKIQNGKFTADEKKKIIEEIKQYALSNNRWGYIRLEGFIPVVAELALFSLASNDKEIAEGLMKEAEVFVRPETKNYVDYASKLFLAVGNSIHHPEKSFAIMESLGGINELIESAVKLGVFFDIESIYVPNGEVNGLFFLGELNITRGFSDTAELLMFIQNLAKADFERTKNLADKFEKREFKMTAKILILESLLGEPRELRREYY